MGNINDLLTEIKVVNKKYETIAERTGEKFNIFKILKRESDEVRTHSAFIAELLNPRGCHDYKDIFLKMFVQMEGYEFLKDLDLNSVDVKIEEVIFNGRIDIVIKAKDGKGVVIENKIYAQDQPQQLVRYKAAYPNYQILYLTLEGKGPDISSISDGKTLLEKGKDFFTISYKKDICNWLNECKLNANGHPILRETISQYIYLIKYLTHTTMNEENKNELVNSIVATTENIESAESIVRIWSDVKYKIISNIKIAIQNAYRDYNNDLNLQVFFDYEENQMILGQQDSCFWFIKKDWENVGIFFYFNSDLESIVFCINKIDFKKGIANPFPNEFNIKLVNTGKQQMNYCNLQCYKFAVWNETAWKEKEAKIPEEIHSLLNNILEYLK